MAVRRVFAIWTHALFIDSVRSLLNQPGIEWAGATSDHAAALEQIVCLQPDTILVEEAIPGPGVAEVVEIMEACSSDVQVIRLGLADNKLTLYCREQRMAAGADDLLRLVQGAPTIGSAQ